MWNRSGKQPGGTVPVHLPRPGERFVLVEDLVKDEGVRQQIRGMAEIGGDSDGADDLGRILRELEAHVPPGLVERGMHSSLQDGSGPRLRAGFVSGG